MSWPQTWPLLRLSSFHKLLLFNFKNWSSSILKRFWFLAPITSLGRLFQNCTPLKVRNLLISTLNFSIDSLYTFDPTSVFFFHLKTSTPCVIFALCMYLHWVNISTPIFVKVKKPSSFELLSKKASIDLTILVALLGTNSTLNSSFWNTDDQNCIEHSEWSYSKWGPCTMILTPLYLYCICCT